jgi:hypothetical protein
MRIEATSLADRISIGVESKQTEQLRKSAISEAGDGICGLGPEFCVSLGSTGLAPHEPERASCCSPDCEYHLPFHAVHLSGP